jgi:hypothetical protein
MDSKIKYIISFSKKWWSNIWYSKFLLKLEMNDVIFKKNSSVENNGDQVVSESTNDKDNTFVQFVVNKESNKKFLKLFRKFGFWHSSWNIE